MLMLLLLCTVGYSLLLLYLSRGLFTGVKELSREQPNVSVIVAARNEADNIETLLHALAKQDYPIDKHEIIIVDDGSTDSTAELVTGFQKEYPHCPVKLLSAPDREQAASPKKNALRTGIQNSSGEILLFTDADCTPPAGWISGMVGYFTPETGMVIGFSPYETGGRLTLFQKLIALDALALAALAAATTGLGRPATCNGRNLAYRRELWDRVGGFQGIDRFVSGDDDLFLKKVLQHGGTTIRYALNPGVAVPTRPLQSIRQFVNQRLRHASKGFFYSPKQVAALTLLYLYYLLLFIGVPLGFLISSGWISILILLTKSAGEFVLLFFFSKKMSRLSALSVFPLAELLYTPYVVLFGLLGQFQRFNWKGNESGAVGGESP